MRWRQVFAFTWLVVVTTACPETWREGGTIDRAMEKDIEAELHRHNCPLSKREWTNKCGIRALWGDNGCPHQCQFEVAE